MNRRLMVLVALACMAAMMLAVAGMASAAGGKPVIKNLAPAPNSTITDTTPTIGATVRDRKTNLAKRHIRLFVDGTQVTTFAYNRNTDRLSYTTDVLASGAHNVKIVARDKDRNVAAKSWSFTVDSSCGAQCTPF